MSEKKINKITYKIYFNDRLKQVSFHGEQTHPLYIQVTYERKSIFFKSYYFELLSKPHYLLKIPGVGEKGPAVADCIEKEKQVIEFIIEKHKDDFSLDLFRGAYLYYSKDLCDIFQGGFIQYMHTFFWDEGSPALGDVVLYGCKDVIAFDVLRSFERSFKPELYKKLVGNALYYAPPYIPVYGFMQELHRWPTKMLSVMEMNNQETILKFSEYLLKRYSDEDAATILKQVADWQKYW
ncbi:MAG: hypothetical protein V4594_02785 [Bacteroidota bacterium]